LNSSASRIVKAWVNIAQNHPAFPFQQGGQFVKGCLSTIHVAKHYLTVERGHFISNKSQSTPHDFTLCTLRVALDHGK
jgi:hypothetical protein